MPSSGMLPAMLQNPAALPTPPTGLWLHPKGGGCSSEDIRCRDPGRDTGTGQLAKGLSAVLLWVL